MPNPNKLYQVTLEQNARIEDCTELFLPQGFEKIVAIEFDYKRPERLYVIGKSESESLGRARRVLYHTSACPKDLGVLVAEDDLESVRKHAKSTRPCVRDITSDVRPYVCNELGYYAEDAELGAFYVEARGNTQLTNVLNGEIISPVLWIGNKHYAPFGESITTPRDFIVFQEVCFTPLIDQPSDISVAERSFHCRGFTDWITEFDINNFKVSDLSEILRPWVESQRR